MEEYIKNKKRFWNEQSEKSTNVLNEGYKNKLIQIYKFLIPPGNRILEIGSGRGDLLAALKPSYGVGIDISDKPLQLINERDPSILVKNGNVNHLPITKNLKLKLYRVL